MCKIYYLLATMSALGTVWESVMAWLLAQPPARVSGALSEQGKYCTQGGSGKRGFCNGCWQPPVPGAGAGAAGGLSFV